MAITINGSGTITGVSAGGLPDNCITADDLATTLDLSGNTITLPSGTGGKVLQVVNTVVSDNGDIASTSTSFVDSGVDILITPTSTSSKILLILQGGGMHCDTDNETMYTTIYRDDTTNLGASIGGLSRLWVRTGRGITPHSLSVYDSPNTTSQVKYSPYFRCADGYQVRFKTNNAGNLSFTAIEVGA